MLREQKGLHCCVETRLACPFGVRSACTDLFYSISACLYTRAHPEPALLRRNGHTLAAGNKSGTARSGSPSRACSIGELLTGHGQLERNTSGALHTGSMNRCVGLGARSFRVYLFTRRLHFFRNNGNGSVPVGIGPAPERTSLQGGRPLARSPQDASWGGGREQADRDDRDEGSVAPGETPRA